MGQEPVYFKNEYFYENSQIVSYVQKFMELYLLSINNHAKWFNEIIADLNGNFHIPYWKYFFDEDIIGKDKERLDYCLNIIELTIDKMESINKREFIEYIRNDLKGTWCDLEPASFYDEEWLNENESYRKHYIGILYQLKELMTL